jgi:hypothetical protein
MKAYLGGALALVALSGCAAVTQYTGITDAQQRCIAGRAVYYINGTQTGPTDLSTMQIVAQIAADCGISAGGSTGQMIETAVLAAEKAE